MEKRIAYYVSRIPKKGNCIPLQLQKRDRIRLQIHLVKMGLLMGLQFSIVMSEAMANLIAATSLSWPLVKNVFCL